MYPVSEYRISKFEKSPISQKKYRVHLRNKTTGKEVSIDFGQIGYQHYKDSTPLKLYSSFDHNDKLRLSRYKKRFGHLYDPNIYSPTFFSWKYLW